MTGDVDVGSGVREVCGLEKEGAGKGHWRQKEIITTGTGSRRVCYSFIHLVETQ